MDYKEQIEYLRYLEQQSQHIEASAFARAARSISDLLARAEAAKARAEKAERCIAEIEDALKFGRYSSVMLRISEYRGQKEE